jgi:uncharacterized Zn finger protein
MPERRECSSCHCMVAVRKDGTLRSHKNRGVVCDGGAPSPGRKAGETIEAKASRYLAEGRVQILSVHGDQVVAHVRGSQPDPYEVRYNGTVWTCSCEAQTWRCSHVVAVQQVVGSRYQQHEVSDDDPGSELDELLGDRFVQRSVKEDIEV